MRKPIVLITLTFAIVSLAAASAEARDRGNDQTIRCESNGEKTTYCATHTTGYVELSRQLSKARCEAGDSWDADNDGGGIWVRNGCRAEFVVRENRGWGRWRGRDRVDERASAPASGRVHCTSDNFAYNHCDVNGRVRDARISRQISKTRCQRGDNWDVDRSGIWVNNGCEAEFEVR